MKISLFSYPNQSLKKNLSRLRPSVSSTTSRAAHFQFVPETPNPADGNIFHSFHLGNIYGDIFTHFVLSIFSALVPGPTEKMTLLQSVTDALDIALTKVAQF